MSTDETLNFHKSYLLIFILFFVLALYVWRQYRAEEMSEIDKFSLLIFTQNWARR